MNPLQLEKLVGHSHITGLQEVHGQPGDEQLLRSRFPRHEVFVRFGWSAAGWCAMAGSLSLRWGGARLSATADSTQIPHGPLLLGGVPPEQA